MDLRFGSMTHANPSRYPSRTNEPQADRSRTCDRDLPVAVFAADRTPVHRNEMWSATAGDPGRYHWPYDNLAAASFRIGDPAEEIGRGRCACIRTVRTGPAGGPPGAEDARAAGRAAAARRRDVPGRCAASAFFRSGRSGEGVALWARRIPPTSTAASPPWPRRTWRPGCRARFRPPRQVPAAGSATRCTGDVLPARSVAVNSRICGAACSARVNGSW